MKRFVYFFGVIFVLLVSDLNTAFANGKIEVTFWHAMNAHNQEILTELVNEFNESQDRIIVKEQNQGDNNQLTQKIMAATLSNELPTIGQLISAKQPELIDSGAILSLDSLIENGEVFNTELFNDIYEGFLPEVTLNGKIYGIPFNKSVRVMYVNKTILEEVGSEIPASWEDIETLGKVLEEKGKEIPAIGIENSLPTEIETLARSNGSEWISQDLKTVEIASDKSIAPLIKLQELINKGYARTAGEDGFMSEPFGQGASAIYYGSSAGLNYFLPQAEENGYEITAIEVPSFSDTKAGILFGNNISLFSSASEEEQKAAMEFLAFLLSEENTVRWAIGSGYLPITKSGVNSDAWQEHLANNPILNAATETLNYATSSPSYLGQGEVYSELEVGIEEVLINGSEAKDVMTNIENLVKEKLGLN